MKIGRNDKCPCGSGSKYKKCCMDKEDKPEAYSNLPVQSRIESLVGEGKIKQCIHPKHEECSENIIRAHSVQNNKIIKSISTNGNVIMLRPEITETSFKFAAKTKGRKVATTFSGFCGFHDKRVFQPIEDKEFEGTKQQYFLFAYRAFAFEYHKKCEAYNSITKHFKSKPSLANDRWFIENLKGHEAGIKDLDYYKQKFDQAVLENNFSLIDTVCLRLEGESKVAVCSGFHLEFDLFGKRLNNVKSLTSERMKFLMFNLFPQNNETIVLFSWLSEDTKFYEGFRTQLLNLTLELQVNFLNNLIPNYCENTIINPDYYNSLSSTEKHELFNVCDNAFTILDDLQKKNLLREPKYNLFKSLEAEN